MGIRFKWWIRYWLETLSKRSADYAGYYNGGPTRRRSRFSARKYREIEDVSSPRKYWMVNKFLELAGSSR